MLPTVPSFSNYGCWCVEVVVVFTLGGVASPSAFSSDLPSTFSTFLTFFFLLSVGGGGAATACHRRRASERTARCCSQTWTSTRSHGPWGRSPGRHSLNCCNEKSPRHHRHHWCPRWGCPWYCPYPHRPPRLGWNRRRSRRLGLSENPVAQRWPGWGTWEARPWGWARRGQTGGGGSRHHLEWRRGGRSSAGDLNKELKGLVCFWQRRLLVEKLKPR